MYKLLKSMDGQVRNDCVFKVDTNMYVPFDPANTDYQAYLKWLEAGNQPLPADQPGDQQ